MVVPRTRGRDDGLSKYSQRTVTVRVVSGGRVHEIGCKWLASVERGPHHVDMRADDPRAVGKVPCTHCC